MTNKNAHNANDRFGGSSSRSISGIYTFLLVFTSIFLSACSEINKPQPEPFYAETVPPAKQEFRWSNGKAPKSFDPAKASAAPETDVARALFEGLTNTDSKTLKETAGVAERWISSNDFKVWTFFLRENAKWSNGKPVTARDFVRSWRRLAEMGDEAAHANLLSNFAGLPARKAELPETADDADFLLNSITNRSSPLIPQSPDNSNTSVPQIGIAQNSNSARPTPDTADSEAENKLGFIAETDFILKVTLTRPDKDFPKLVAHPIFSPIHGDGREFEKPDTAIVTNGAFGITANGTDGITLDKSENYWNRNAIKIERVRFVPMENAEAALEAYRRGELDAVTNGEFAPLALKLLSPYRDFRRTTFSALNFYEVNSIKPPFTDRRVRQALSSAIDRERLTEGDLEGTTQPALSFLPFGTLSHLKMSQDKEKARDLLDESGFPNGENFPVIKLLINRNDTQQRIARSVARMWKQNLNLETEIIVKEASEFEAARKSSDFDLIRRGVVFPTANESANFRAIFETDGQIPVPPPAETTDSNNDSHDKPAAEPDAAPRTANSVEDYSLAFAEENAIFECNAIPLYFPVSYSLVKPYVSGFELNSLDAPSLKDVLIDNNWQPEKVKGES
ncbi:MAG: peptide ABC transporter substrate-binding protein [Pyrinomonadaceae bacterium]